MRLPARFFVTYFCDKLGIYRRSELLRIKGNIHINDKECKEKEKNYDDDDEDLH